MARDLFSYLTLPKLKHLVFDGRRSDTVFPTDQLLGLVRRSGFSITDLTLSKPIISEADLMRLLLAMPTIQNLNLKLPEANNSTSFLGCLSQKAMRNQIQSPFLPSLVRLDMEAISPKYWSMFVEIFDDHPEVPGPPSETPLRKDLKISFFTLLDVNDRSRNHLIDDDSIQKLIHLWRVYGIFIDLQLQGPSVSEVYDLLMVSFDRRLLLHPATQEQTEHPTYIAIEKMSLLTF
ncbi:hypothetical protein D9619_012312 [Psilocybe cf. subviscida]|uniref:Uncharacterized protein n=1 Tax=Psilocybe cf. subviscida TaxID=2480587 RepID=A0A8H5ASE1_9AGAR|nr:hypothetical protein D9619_012312 [Psilocybe cf. subviscida]